MLVCPSCYSIYSTQTEFCGIDGAALTETPVDPLLGRTIDRYLITEALGSGAMGCVYRASHETLERDYALKMLYGQTASDRQFIERFKREANAVSRMNHPNVVSVLDFGRTPNGLTFLVMEYVAGRPLDEIMSEDGPFDHARVIRLMRQIAAGLSEAHRLGFVHRDLKPGNVLVTQTADGEVAKILDFGLVGLMEAEGPALTETGVTMGTPQYMAPEQTLDARVGPSADLYALGVTAFHMLTGDVPFSGAARQVMVKHSKQAPPPLDEHGELGQLILQLLEKSPADRPPSAEAVIQQLDRLAPEPELLAAPETWGVQSSTGDGAKRPSTLLLILAACCTIVAIAVGIKLATPVAADTAGYEPYVVPAVARVPVGTPEATTVPVVAAADTAESPAPIAPSAPTRRAWEAKVQTTGGLDSEAASTAVASISSLLRRCRAGAHDERLYVVVKPTGDVMSWEVRPTGARAQTISGCLSDAPAALRFQAFEGGAFATVKIPLGGGQ